MNMLGNAYQEEGRVQDAIDIFRDSLSRFPPSAFTLNNLAILLANDPATIHEAISLLEQSLVVTPNHTGNIVMKNLFQE